MCVFSYHYICNVQYTAVLDVTVTHTATVIMSYVLFVVHDSDRSMETFNESKVSEVAITVVRVSHIQLPLNRISNNPIRYV